MLQFSLYLHGDFVLCNMHDLLNQTVEVFLVYSASGSRSLKALYTNADVKIRKTWKRSYTEFSSYIEHQLCAMCECISARKSLVSLTRKALNCPSVEFLRC